MCSKDEKVTLRAIMKMSLKMHDVEYMIRLFVCLKEPVLKAMCSLWSLPQVDDAINCELAGIIYHRLHDIHIELGYITAPEMSISRHSVDLGNFPCSCMHSALANLNPRVHITPSIQSSSWSSGQKACGIPSCQGAIM